MTDTQTQKTNRTTLTVPEAASYLGLAVSTLNKWRVYGGGPRFLKLGRAIRYRAQDLELWLEAQLVGSTAQY